MSRNSKIEWTDHTWNPIIGCYKVSTGCKYCYAERDMKRWGKSFKPHRASDAVFYSPLKWKEPARVFTCSYSDFFLEDADSYRDEIWNIIKNTPHLTYQILTKRPENILDRLPDNWGYGYKNVWLGVSVEKMEFIKRIDILIDIPAHIRFISYEPALGKLVIASPSIISNIHWIIAGGESGHGYKWRPANTEWFRLIRDQCLVFKIPFFFKQYGGNKKINGTWGGNKLDGTIHNQFPVTL